MDDKITRILTPYFALKQDQLPEIDYSRVVVNKKHDQVIRKVASSAITLLKNNRTSSTTALPIANPRTILLVGSAAGEGRYGIVSNQASPIFFYKPDAPYIGTISDGFGSGGSPAPHVITPLRAIQDRAAKSDDFIFVDGCECTPVAPSHCRSNF